MPKLFTVCLEGTK